jgi:hypothetical protein
MSRVTALFVGIAALTVISTAAEAAQGCGRGWYYNGRRCVPQDDVGYRSHHRRYVDEDDIGYRRRHHRPGISIALAYRWTSAQACGFISETILERGITMMMMIKLSAQIAAAPCTR